MRNGRRLDGQERAFFFVSFLSSYEPRKPDGCEMSQKVLDYTVCSLTASTLMNNIPHNTVLRRTKDE